MSLLAVSISVQHTKIDPKTKISVPDCHTGKNTLPYNIYGYPPIWGTWDRVFEKHKNYTELITITHNLFIGYYEILDTSNVVRVTINDIDLTKIELDKSKPNYAKIVKGLNSNQIDDLNYAIKLELDFVEATPRHVFDRCYFFLEPKKLPISDLILLQNSSSRPSYLRKPAYRCRETGGKQLNFMNQNAYKEFKNLADFMNHF